MHRINVALVLRSACLQLDVDTRTGFVTNKQQCVEMTNMLTSISSAHGIKIRRKSRLFAKIIVCGTSADDFQSTFHVSCTLIFLLDGKKQHADTSKTYR